ncbi:thioredoxin family protein [Chitinophaga nivalis]|uniref:Thioredoxin family protein n=1 Tax=Chitinophaga nivalis TaxID=2991709 RepID=A0ABT3IRC4_9BACT|nr:thioredoxin family protein [Chitinophaga nivalis]MCW3463799.1 thioredoxin family protein [Chitinophaga nivalis]MCW3486511.1 thioredoxin family protein [Chitinophaga nivalis]
MIKLVRMMNICFFLGAAIAANAQEKTAGIVFRQDAFAAVLAESGRTGKPVFIDCYTSWCSPCKWMEKNVFVNDTAAAFYNAKFINYKIDMEKGEGPALRQRYGVQVFPTYLFLNAKGELIHKATSRMEMPEFVEEGKKALDPARSFVALEKAFREGNRSNEVLLSYALALQKTDRNKGDSVSSLLMAQLTDADLKTPLGWQAIQAFAWSEEDRLGKYFLANVADYTKNYGRPAVAKIEERLQSTALYALMRKKDSTAFFARLAPWQQSADPALQKKALMMEADYYLGIGDAKNFIRVTDKGLKGWLQKDDVSLSFIARRCQYLGEGNRLLMQQAYRLAKQAVVVAPREYSNQSTLAKVCQDMGNREEALEAAEAAYQLSLAETSKIQGLAKKHLEEIRQMK